MTLDEMLRLNPEQFIPQSWYWGEDFLLESPEPFTPQGFIRRGELYGVEILPKASSLVACYLQNPDLRLWDDYIWCADRDRHGQRIYVGGKSNTGKLEIHRHIHLSKRFGVVSW